MYDTKHKFVATFNFLNTLACTTSAFMTSAFLFRTHSPLHPPNHSFGSMTAVLLNSTAVNYLHWLYASGVSSDGIQDT